MSGDNDNSGEEEHKEKAAGKRKTKRVKLQKTYCSDDESNGGDTCFSKEDGEDSKALNLNGKTRASRGAATDPQSLYARVRNLYIDYILVKCFKFFNQRYVNKTIKQKVKFLIIF